MMIRAVGSLKEKKKKRKKERKIKMRKTVLGEKRMETNQF
jgi:hypothetical protein